jgi:hypothetical protein
MRNKITNEQIEFIIENYSENGINYCSDILNLPKSTVASIARRKSLKVNRDILIRNMSKSIIKVEDYIDVESKEIAYILGLIWADYESMVMLHLLIIKQKHQL